MNKGFPWSTVLVVALAVIGIYYLDQALSGVSTVWIWIAGIVAIIFVVPPLVALFAV